MTLQTVHLGLGTNVGDRADNLRRAMALLGERLNVSAVSSVYETEPWGYTDQPRFLNMACAAEAEMAPAALLTFIQSVEQAVGREPSFRYGPRAIDVDILLWGDVVSESESLTIPHPALHERAFALAPLAEIAPDVQHPVVGKSVLELLTDVPGRDTVRRMGPL